MTDIKMNDVSTNDKKMDDIEMQDINIDELLNTSKLKLQQNQIQIKKLNSDINRSQNHITLLQQLISTTETHIDKIKDDANIQMEQIKQSTKDLINKIEIARKQIEQFAKITYEPSPSPFHRSSSPTHRFFQSAYTQYVALIIV